MSFEKFIYHKVSLGVGSQTILHNVSLEIAARETVGLIGSSGSGKSMLVKSIYPFLLPKGSNVSGQIKLKHKSQETECLTLGMKRVNPVLLQEVAIILQDSLNALNPNFTIGQQMQQYYRQLVRMGQRPITEMKTSIQAVLQAVRLDSSEAFLAKYPYQLSGGMKQRVNIALALLARPSLLIADESTTALDAINKQEVIKTLQVVNQNLGVAVLFISHDLSLVAQLCERIYVMDQGQVVETGPRTAILESPQSTMGQKLVQAYQALQSHGAEEASAGQEKVPILVAEGLCYHLPDKHILKEVSFELYARDALGVVGSSGSGKTTLASVLTGIRQSTAGRIIYEGKAIHGKSLAMFRDIQIIPQNPYNAFDPFVRIRDHMAEIIRMLSLQKGIPEATSWAYLAQLMATSQVEEALLDRMPKQLSGGQLQRLSMIRILLLRPKILIADEITSSVDLSAAIGIVDLLRKLQEELSFSLIFISHDMAMVRQVCNRLLILAEGEVQECGQTQEVLNHPQKAVSQALIVAAGI